MPSPEPPIQPTFRSDVTVQLVKHTAGDADILFAARVSTMGQQSLDELAKDPERSKGLINYLMRDRHGSPFEHTSMTFLISAPIFVFREFMRHRAGWSYNEESGRYRELQPVFYIPGPDRKLVQQGKPGRYKFIKGTVEQADQTYQQMSLAYQEAYDSYRGMLSAGIAREVARSVLPVGLYSSMYASCNARSLMHFLGLRTTHPDAQVPSFPQREIEMVGEQMEAEWAKLMPLAYEFQRGPRRPTRDTTGTSRSSCSSTRPSAVTAPTGPTRAWPPARLSRLTRARPRRSGRCAPPRRSPRR